MGAAVANDGFDFIPGAQVPLQGSAGQTAATHALASAAYRDSPVEDILKANGEWHKTEVKKGKFSLFEPNLGESFSRAVQVRMLGGTRKALIQSFGTEPQTVVEHCLAATRIRKERDTRLTIVMGVFGLVFLPGLLIWLGVFQLRRTLSGSRNRSMGALGTALLVAVGGLVVLFLVKLPFGGIGALYLRLMLVAPVIGWVWAKRICERTAVDLRSRWDSLLSGGGIGPKIPEAVPRNPTETAAEQLRQSLAKLTAEQQSNSVFYSRPQGDTRHGHPLGQLAARRGAGPPRGGHRDPRLPQLGRHPGHPRPAADAGARPAAHRRLPHPVREALDRGARR